MLRPQDTSTRERKSFRELFDVARRADPTRPVGFVNVRLAPQGKCQVSKFGDV
jgi:beta-glucuronidase